MDKWWGGCAVKVTVKTFLVHADILESFAWNHQKIQVFSHELQRHLKEP